MPLRAVAPRSSQALHAVLLAGVSVLALSLASAPARALPLAGAGGASAAAAANAAAAAIASIQQAQQATQQSMSSLLRASQAVAAMQQAQAAARVLAQTARAGVPNGLLPGGLVPDSGLAASGVANPVASWTGLNTPTQSLVGGQTTVTVLQTQQKAIANWSSFNVGQNTELYFNQSAGNTSTGNNWIVLNRVTDPSGVPSQILGEIKAEGSVYVIDANGIVFGGASQVNVHSLIASSLNLFSNDLATSNSRFLNGGIGDLDTTNFSTNSILLTSSGPGPGNITIESGAQINVGTQGLALIAAPNVTNNGAITASNGQVALVAGIGVSYDYNYGSFDAASASANVEADGFNDNTTTNLRFANYGEWTDANGNDITPVGTLTNNGLVYTPAGNITLLGGNVAQNGVAVATTSVQEPGSIVIESLYEVGTHGASMTNPISSQDPPVADPANEADTSTFYTGSVSFGPNAVTSILPDLNGVTLASDPASLAPFKTPLGEVGLTTPLPTQGLGLIEVTGQAIDFLGGTLVYAPGQNLAVSTLVLPDPRVSVPGAGRILLEDGAILDVSGIPDTQLAASYNFLTVALGGNELADSPLQLADALFGATVTVDMRLSGTNEETGESWVGTPLANLASYLNLEQQSIGQLLVNGGTIDLDSNEFVGAPGSIINLMGGYVEFLGGMVDPTRLVSAGGGLYSIGNADPDLTYSIAGELTVDHTHWGVTQTFTSGMLSGGYYEQDYIQGGNAGTLNIGVSNAAGISASSGADVADSEALILDSNLLAGTVSGTWQVNSGTLPTDGTIAFGGTLPIEIGDPASLSQQSLAALTAPVGLGMTSPLLATSGSAFATANVVSSAVLNAGNFGTISVQTTSGLTIDPGTTLTVQPGGAIDLTAGHVTVGADAHLTARAGTIDIATATPELVEAGLSDDGPGDIVVGSGAVLDVSGIFFNESTLQTQQAGLSPLINGGTISLVTNLETSGSKDLTGNITLKSGSLLDLEGGGVLLDGALAMTSSDVPEGTGGNLTLQTYAGIGTPVAAGSAPTRGVLTLDGSVDALGFDAGGTLTLQAVALQIGGDAATTPAYGFYFDPTLWGNRGFDNFDLSSVLQSEVPADAIVRLTHANLLPSLTAVLDAPTGADPGAYSTVGYLTGTLLSPTNLSITAGLEQKSNALDTSGGVDYAQVDAGAQIIADPGAAVSLTSYSMVTIFGDIYAPGGSINLTHDYFPQVSGGPIGPIYLGPQSVLDVSGTSVVNPLAPLVNTLAGQVQPFTGEVLPGGTVTITDDFSAILAAPGSVINVSGASGTFETGQINTNRLGRQAEALTSTPMWSDAGTVNITGGTGLLFEGTLIGNPGAPQANGGTLDVTGVVNPNTGTDTTVVLVQDTAAIATTAGATFNFATYVPQAGAFTSTFTSEVQVDPNIQNMMLVGADTLQNSGFTSLELNSPRNVGFAGQVSLSLGDTFATSAQYFIAYDNKLMTNFGAAAPAGGASLSLTAPFVSITGGGITNNGFPSPTSPPPESAGGTLTLTGTRELDLSGFIDLQSIGQATFISDGDLRLLPAPFAPPGGDKLIGYLVTTGNLTFEAADVYPATDTAYFIEAVPFSTGPAPTITFEYPNGVAPSMTTPLSAAGELVVDAGTIAQNGEIQAPFGSIVLGIDGATTTLNSIFGSTIAQSFSPTVDPTSVTLGTGSITSVSANGAVIPFGSTVDQASWIYNPFPNNPSWGGVAQATAFTDPLTASPQGVISVDGGVVNVNSGALIDLNGGGTLYAQEWVPGTGGSRNVLAQFQTSFANSAAGQQVPTYADGREIFAIVPGYNGAVAPYDANLTQGGLTAGSSVYLDGGNGLPPGMYTLLPAQYATLPGAYRVVVNSGVVNPVVSKTETLADGTLQMTGYLANSLSGTRESEAEQFYVQPESVWGKYSEYALTDAATFFPAYAATNGLATPVVPADAGRLAIAAETDLVLNGTLLGRPGPGGFGAQVDISGEYIEITDNSTGTTSVVTGALNFNGSGTQTLGTGGTIDLSGTLSGGDSFTFAPSSLSTSGDAVIGTLTVPNGSLANLSWMPFNGFLTLTNQSVTLASGDTFSGTGTISVKTQDIDQLELGLNGFSNSVGIPASSVTQINVASAATSTFTYSFGSGSGASALTFSSTMEFTVGGVNVPFNAATGLYSTSTYSAGQTVTGTADGQVITLTTGSAVGTNLGAGGSLEAANVGTLNLALAPAVANSTVVYNLGNGGATVLAFSPLDSVNGSFLLQGGANSQVLYPTGSYPVINGQTFTGFTGTSPVTFTANMLDKVGYTGPDANVSLTTSQNYLQISAEQLDSFGATSLLIGGLRSETSAGEVIAPTANGILVNNNSSTPLTAPEILFAAAPVLSTTTLSLDDDNDSTTVATPLAGTGQVLFEPGSVVEAEGTIGAGAPSTLFLGNPLSNLPNLPSSLLTSNLETFTSSTPETEIAAYYADVTAALGTLVRLANGAPVDLVRPTASQLSPGAITVTDNLNTANPAVTVALPSLAGFGAAVVDPGATLAGGNDLTLSSTGDVQIQSGAILSGTNISFNSSQITFLGAGSSASGGAAVAPVVLQNVATADLQSTGTISFEGNVDIAMSNGALTLGAGSFTSDGGQVSINAASLTLDNEMGAPSPASTGGTGTLVINAGQLVFGTGDKSLQGFGALSIVASEGVFGQDTGSMDFGALPVTLQTPAVIAEPSSLQTLTTTGALAIVPLAGTSAATIPEQLGGAIGLQGGSVTIAVPVEAAAGNIDVTASTGDIIVTGTGALVTHGVAEQFNDLVEYASAGNITLSATAGTVDIQPGALVDFSGAAAGGNGGNLSIVAPGPAPVVLGGTFLGSSAAGFTGSNFSLDTGGAVGLDALAQILNGAGISGDINVQTGQGDLTLNGTLNATQVTLVANAGMVTVNGAINANGTSSSVGEISLYGTAGVDVEGSLLATGSPNSQSAGGQITLGTSGATLESISTNTIGTGTQTFTIQAGLKGLSSGLTVTLADSTDASQGMTGTVSSYNPATGALVVNVTRTSGSGTYSNWTGVSYNATYGYENVDPSASGTITVGANAIINASGGTVTFRAPILDALNANGSNVNVTVAPGARISAGLVDLDAYAVWSTADQGPNPDQHFDGYVDPAGWYDSNGNLVSGTFTDPNGNIVLNYTAGTMTAAQLATYLTNDYFTPDPGRYDSAHAIFYGGFDPNTESFNPSAPDAGTLPAFIQNPGLVIGNGLADVVNFQARPEVDLINPSNANGGVNNGNITVLTNWNLGAGVMNADGSLTLAYRYQGSIAPVIGLRAAGNVVLDASITDGFFQTAGVSLTTPASVLAQFEASYAYAEQQYLADVEESDSLATTQIEFIDQSTGPLMGTIDPNIEISAPEQGGSSIYYQNYLSYLNDWTGTWVGALDVNYGFIIPLTAPSVAAPNASDPAFAGNYASYLAAYSNWLETNFTVSTLNTAGTPTAPTAPTDPTLYPAYVTADQNYINYLFDDDYNPSTFATVWIYAPVAPGFIAPSGPPASLPAAGANAPSNMATAINPSPVQFASLVGGESSSYVITAGANLASANPSGVADSAQFAAGSTSGLAGEGNVIINGHTAYTITGTYQIEAPTTVRTGSGSIDISAPGDFSLTDTIAPGVVYTAGVPVEPAPADDDTTVALGQGAFQGQNNDFSAFGVSTILTPAVNAGGAGDLTLTVGGNIIGIENVVDTLATSNASQGSGVSSNRGSFIGQFWEAWLLENPADANVPWYVNFGSFDQGLMSLGGNVTVKAGGDIHDLAVSLPTTGYLDASNELHVSGGGLLNVTAGGSIYSGDFYVGQGAGTIVSGGTVAPDFNYVSADDTGNTYPVATLLAVQYGTIAVEARQSVDIGGVYDPTYLWAPGMGDTITPPIASTSLTADGQSFVTVSENLIPYFTTMSADSGVSVQATSGTVTFNSAIAFGDMLGMGSIASNAGIPEVSNPAAFVPSLLLPASLDLTALGGSIDIGYGGGLYPSATGTLSLIADQSINLGVTLLTGAGSSSEPYFTEVGNVFGTVLEKLAYPVGAVDSDGDSILPTASDPQLTAVWNLPDTQTADPALIADQASDPVRVYALTGDITDGILVTAADGGVRQWANLGAGGSGALESLPTNVAVGGVVDQISLVTNAPAEIYAGGNITDLPFYGTNFSAADVTSIIAGGNISYALDGDQQTPAIELAGPGTLDVIAGGNISFESQRIAGVTESGIRTLGNAIDTTADPILNTAAPAENSSPFSPLSFMADFGNPYLPTGGAAVNVLFGVGPGMNTAGFIRTYIDPATSGAVGSNSAAELVGFVTQYEKDKGAQLSATLSTAQAWAIFQSLPANQQQLLVEQVFFDILNTTGLDYNDASSAAFHSYAAGYQAINTLFPASDGYTSNDLTGGSNGANQLVNTGTLDLRGSTIQTQQGGNISVIGPGGRVLVGSADASPAVDPASEGILTLENGNIDIFADQSVLVAQSRIMTEQGGDVVMWSSNGDLDAGEGAKTSVSAPSPLFSCDIAWICSVDVKGQVSGAGIATLQSLPDVPIGNANLMAPRGTVNAGAAGVRVSGNLNIAALQVLNAFNFDVQGVATGLPGVASPNIGALTDASSAAGAAAKTIAPAQNNATVSPSILIVEIEGYGGDDDSDSDSASPEQNIKKRKPLLNLHTENDVQDPQNRVQVLGVGPISENRALELADERRRLVEP